MVGTSNLGSFLELSPRDGEIFSVQHGQPGGTAQLGIAPATEQEPGIAVICCGSQIFSCLLGS